MSGACFIYLFFVIAIFVYTFMFLIKYNFIIISRQWGIYLMFFFHIYMSRCMFIYVFASMLLCGSVWKSEVHFRCLFWLLSSLINGGKVSWWTEKSRALASLANSFPQGSSVSLSQESRDYRHTARPIGPQLCLLRIRTGAPFEQQVLYLLSHLPAP